MFKYNYKIFYQNGTYWIKYRWFVFWFYIKEFQGVYDIIWKFLKSFNSFNAVKDYITNLKTKQFNKIYTPKRLIAYY